MVIIACIFDGQQIQFSERDIPLQLTYSLVAYKLYTHTSQYSVSSTCVHVRGCNCLLIFFVVVKYLLWSSES